MRKLFSPLIALAMLLAILPGCGGGDGVLGNSITANDVNGAFSATRSAGDTLDVSFAQTGTALTGSARLTPSVGGTPTTVNITNASIVNNVVSFTATFGSTPYVVSGTLSGTSINGTLNIGTAQPENISLTKIADTSVSMAATWSGTFVYTSGSLTGKSGAVSATFTQTAGSNLFSGTGVVNFDNSGNANTTYNGSVFGNKVETGFAASGGLSVRFTGTVNGNVFAGTFATSFGAGTFTVAK